MSEPVDIRFKYYKTSSTDFFSDNNPVLKSMNLSMKDATKLGAIMIILVIFDCCIQNNLIKNI